MELSKAEVRAVLRQFNPWWTGSAIPDLPHWRRPVFKKVFRWLEAPPSARALLLTGARRVGKTTLLLQLIQKLLSQGTPPSNILYLTLDHPILKLEGLDRLTRLWRESEPAADGPEFVLLDEVHAVRDWQVWIKHQVDFVKNRRIAATGSATPLLEEGQESGAGRWHEIEVAPLSFYEFLLITKRSRPKFNKVRSLVRLLSWSPADFARATTQVRELEPEFSEYLLRGGFPETAMIPTITLAQKLLREDIVDRILKRDMTALFQVRRVVELEQLFVYLCLHDSGIIDLTQIVKSLQLPKQTVSRFLSLLEAAHLIHTLRPHGYGKEILRGGSKIYLADAAIGPSVLLRGRDLLSSNAELGRAVETAVFMHMRNHYHSDGIQFSYWRGKKGAEVDFVAQAGAEMIAVEVKHRGSHTDLREMPGLVELCRTRTVHRAYVITRDADDVGRTDLPGPPPVPVLKIPAPLACYLLGASEAEGADGEEVE
ncbi:MAG: ATP-binding protein [Planctomycetes bacterium]|nr:ATP-binding protein [Planctomycetota bacterium]